MKYIKLSSNEKKEFYNILKKLRSQSINSAVDTANIIFNRKKDTIKKLIDEENISQLIMLLREESYDYFLQEEAIFNEKVLLHLGNGTEISKEILNSTVAELSKLDFTDDKIYEYVNVHFSNYASTIYPYLYELSLSNTNSRRSRAGKTFETIIYKLYEYLEYPYDSQARIGKSKFTDVGLGKIVDSILPSRYAFIKFRNKCIVGSMKTTLRERWQEVVEEVQRSNLPNIYLLTVDEYISENKIIQMANHNIILVTLKEVNIKLNKFHNVISFEKYFLRDIPEIINYWGKEEL